MSEEKKSDFVVSDRRRFGAEGALRPDATADEEPAAPPQPPPATLKPTPAPETAAAAPQPAVAPAAPAPQAAAAPAPAHEAAGKKEDEDEDEDEGLESAELPPPPTASQQQEKHEAYKATTQKLDDLIGAPERGPVAEMNFERVIESFLFSALIQLGQYPPDAPERQIDIMGARQTIDSLSVLQEKTKGNLTEREQAMLQNVLFQLRMAWIEITNAIAAAPPPKPGSGSPHTGQIK